MLAFILKTLGIIGLVLLIFLCILLLLVVLVLFFPIRYNVFGMKTGETIELKFKAKWLFGLLRVHYNYPQPGKWKVKLLCFDLIKEIKKPVEEKVPAKEPQPEEIVTVNEGCAKEEPLSVDDMQEGNEKSFCDKILVKYEKIKYTIRNLYDKIKHVWDNIRFYKGLILCEDTQALIKHVIRRVCNILKEIKPKKLHADILFGTGAPDTTGYVLGVYGVLSAQIHKPSYINLTPDFEKAILEGRMEATGRIMLFTLVKNGFMLLFDKKLKLLLKKLKGHNISNKPQQ